MAPTSPRLRLALTLPGGVSLGSYYGGALAALITAVQHSDGRLVVDAIATASAGSITGLLAARCLLRGVAPHPLMQGAWVDGSDVATLRDRSGASPLSPAVLEQLGNRLLGPSGPPDGPAEGRQQEPIRLSMSLAALAGLSYHVRNVEGRPPVLANTYQDWFDTDLSGDTPRSTYQALVKAALASGANGMGFPPVRLERSADRDRYRTAGIVWLPPDDPLEIWYTDGGTIMNEPLGRTIDLVEGIDDDDGDRRFLLVMPQPPTAATSGRWWQPEPTSWLRTLPEVFKVLTTQSVYDDLRRLEKTNSRLAWKAEVVEAVRHALDGLDAATAVTVDAALRPHLQAAAAAIAESKASVAAGRPPGPADTSGLALADLLSEVMGAATGLRAKRPIRLDIVSPTAGATDPTAVVAPNRQLAGDFLNNFGGFFAVAFRRNDYALGYDNLRTWLHETDQVALLEGTGALAAVDDAAPPGDWLNPELGEASLRTLSREAKANLRRLGWNMARVVWHDRFGRRRRQGPTPLT